MRAVFKASVDVEVISLDHRSQLRWFVIPPSLHAVDVYGQVEDKRVAFLQARIPRHWTSVTLRQELGGLDGHSRGLCL